MNIFILQTLFLLLLAFVLGLILGWWFLKPILCRRSALASGGGAGGDSVGNSGSYSTSGSSAQSNTAGFASSASAAFSGIKADNLQIIEGIGPKMETVLHDNGVMTWSTLAHKTIPELKSILGQHGKKYQIVNPSTWIEQARLAADGNVNDLIALQKRDDNISKLENMLNANEKGGFGKYQQDDLKIIEGIGPKIESLLNNAGINSWQALSRTEPSVIHAILNAAGPRYRLAVPETSPLQAKYADHGEWSKLKHYQDELLQSVRLTSAHQTAGISGANIH